ncbi:MAG: hypothetical protein MZV49_12680 [Rhodopseudomonas palustris]|nr:hypothetical protein [Rhodopseudomonas palustris]
MTAAGTIVIGGKLTVSRLGFGAMRLSGPGIWGDPSDRAAAIRVLQRAVELGVELHRHRRRLRSGDQRAPDRGRAVPVSRRAS